MKKLFLSITLLVQVTLPTFSKEIEKDTLSPDTAKKETTNKPTKVSLPLDPLTEHISNLSSLMTTSVNTIHSIEPHKEIDSQLTELKNLHEKMIVELDALDKHSDQFALPTEQEITHVAARMVSLDDALDLGLLDHLTEEQAKIILPVISAIVDDYTKTQPLVQKYFTSPKFIQIKQQISAKNHAPPEAAQNDPLMMMDFYLKTLMEHFTTAGSVPKKDHIAWRKDIQNITHEPSITKGIETKFDTGMKQVVIVSNTHLQQYLENIKNDKGTFLANAQGSFRNRTKIIDREFKRIAYGENGEKQPKAIEQKAKK